MQYFKNICIAGITAVVLCFFTGCENDLKQVEALTQKSGITPTESSTNLNVIFTDSGFMEYRMQSPQMDHYLLGVKEPYEEFPKGVYIENYDRSNKVKSTMKANYAIRYEGEHEMEEKDKIAIVDDHGKPLNTKDHIWIKKMEARYKIEIINEKGEKLSTEHLYWVKIDSIQRIISDTYTEVITSGGVVRGTVLVANEDFSEWEFQKGSGTIPIDEKDYKKD